MQIIPLNIFKHLYSTQEATILIQFEFSLCVHPWTGHHGQGDRHVHRLQRCPHTPMNWSPRSRWQALPSPPKAPSYTHEPVTAVKVTGTSIASKGALVHPWTGHRRQGDRHFHRLQRCPRTPMNWSPRSRRQALPSPPKVPSAMLCVCVAITQHEIHAPHKFKYPMQYCWLQVLCHTLDL